MAAMNHSDASDVPATIELPAPTASPLTLALGVTLLATGLVTDAVISLLGAVLMLSGAVGWFRANLPVERTIEVPAVPDPVTTARPATTHPSGTEAAHR